MLRLYSYLGFTRFAYASYLPYMYDRTVLPSTGLTSDFAAI
jgi:hypothetical protein